MTEWEIQTTVYKDGKKVATAEARDALAAAYETISNMHLVRRARAEMVYAEVAELQEIIAEVEIHREMDSTGACCCGADWPCYFWASDEPLWIDRAVEALARVEGDAAVLEAEDNQ